MANLLPQYAKKRVGSIYRARFGSVLAILATSLALLTLVALLPSLLALALSPLPEEAADAGRLQSEDILSLVRTQALINHVSPVLVATTTPSALVRSALRAKPASVTVQRISYSRGDKEQVVVSGRATREGVRSYRDNLIALDTFTSVSVPVGALVGSEVTAFTVTLVSAQ
ncbi:MAG TPA: hypothetical protein VJB97_02110 [Candidatus Paceibacterota bacterium]